MIPQQLLPKLAVRSRNFNILLVVPPEDRLGIAIELHQRWPRTTKTFLIRHQLLTLLSQLPAAFTHRDMIVALSKSVSTIEFLHRQGLALPAPSMDWAAGFGSFEVLKYLKRQGQRPTEVAFTRAARRGDLKMIQWLERVAVTNPIGGVPITNDAMATAAWGGHLDVLEYLSKLGVGADERAAMLAAGAGHLPVLRWLYNHGVEFGVGTYTLAEAAGHHDIVEFLKSLPGDADGSLEENSLYEAFLEETRVNAHRGVDFIFWAARFSNLEALRRYLPDDQKVINEILNEVDNSSHPEVIAELLRRGGIPDSRILEMAVQHGRLDTVQLLLSHHPDIPLESSLREAITLGHRDIVNLLLSYNPPITSELLATSVRSGEYGLELVFRQLGVAEDYEVLVSYVDTGRLDDVVRMFRSGPVISRLQFVNLLHVAATAGHLSMLTFLFEQLVKARADANSGAGILAGVKLDNIKLTGLYKTATIAGQERVIRWLIDHQVPTTVRGIKGALDYAAQFGYLNIMKLLVQQLPTDTTNITIGPSNIHHLEVAQFILRHQLVGESFAYWLFIQASSKNYLSLVELAITLGHNVGGLDVDQTVLYNHAAILAYLYPLTTQLCSRGAYLIAERNNRDYIARLLRRAGFERGQGAWFGADEYDEAFDEIEDNDDRNRLTDPLDRRNNIQLYLLRNNYNDGFLNYWWQSIWVDQDDPCSETL